MADERSVNWHQAQIFRALQVHPEAVKEALRLLGFIHCDEIHQALTPSSPIQAAVCDAVVYGAGGVAYRDRKVERIDPKEMVVVDTSAVDQVLGQLFGSTEIPDDFRRQMYTDPTTHALVHVVRQLSEGGR